MSDVGAVSTAWMDELWDPEAAMLRHPSIAGTHGVRETACYVVGLAARDDPGDVDRARAALTAVLAQQFDAPGERFHGTFARAPEEPRPEPGAAEWLAYDPNWRQFIGCTLALIDDEYVGGIGPELRDEVKRAIRLAVEGEPDDRVHPTYSNIAMMRAWLDGWFGRRYNEARALARGEKMARAVAGRIEEAGGLDEFNSPTYYGIDLFALALWRGRPPSPVFSELGPRLEAALWRDVADFYHAGMRNLCGPWSRSYGMDMNRYATPLGLYVRQVIGADAAPYPDPSRPFGHAHDMCFGPLIESAATSVPSDVLPALKTFRGPRAVDRIVAERRITAHLDEQAMTGVMSPSGRGWDQLHPATAHWRTGDGRLHWLRVQPKGFLEGEARPHGLRLELDSGGGIADVSDPSAGVRFSREGRLAYQDRSRLAFEHGTLEIEVEEL